MDDRDEVPGHTPLTIAEALRRAGVSAQVALDAAEPGVIVISDVPRGRRPTIERVMASFPDRWRYGARPIK